MLLKNLQLDLSEAFFSSEEVLNKKSAEIFPRENLLIYRNNIHTNFREALQSVYPLVLKLLGKDFFCLTTNEYIKRYPSRDSNLHAYGEYFSDFLSVFGPLKNLRYLSEVAIFEWHCHCLNFAADHPGFNIEDLKKFSPAQYEQLKFTLHPATKILKFHFPILRIVDLCAGEIDDTIDVNEDGVNLLIKRRDFKFALVVLDFSEFTVLSALDQGNSIAEAMSRLPNQASFKLNEKLFHWVQDKIIVGCHL